MTTYDILVNVISPLHLAASPWNIKVGFQVTGMYPFNRDTFHGEEFMGVTLQIDLSLLWLQQLPTVTMKFQRRQLILQDHQNILQRMKHPSSPEDICPLPKAGPRTSQNVNKKKRTTAILTDTSVKNALKKTTVHV
jgi:hypothetical protein